MHRFPLKGVRVLICEDEGIVVMHLRRALQAAGLVIAGAADRAEEAVSLASTIRPDLILMDLQLQGDHDGIEATRRILRIYPCCIVMVSGIGEESAFEAAFDAGACGYLVKPVMREDLEPRLQVIWEGYRLAEATRTPDQAVVEPPGHADL
jgi:DNA-binding NarL/FixJ family response regulator